MAAIARTVVEEVRSAKGSTVVVEERRSVSLPEYGGSWEAVKTDEQARRQRRRC
jgi:hypothetical protein